MTNEQVLYRAVVMARRADGDVVYAYGPYERRQDARSIITRRKHYWSPTTEFQIQKANVVWEPEE